MTVQFFAFRGPDSDRGPSVAEPCRKVYCRMYGVHFQANIFQFDNSEKVQTRNRFICVTHFIRTQLFFNLPPPIFNMQNEIAGRNLRFETRDTPKLVNSMRIVVDKRQRSNHKHKKMTRKKWSTDQNNYKTFKKYTVHNFSTRFDRIEKI